MKVIKLTEIEIIETENIYKLITTCQILDDLENPVRLLALSSFILNNKIELTTNEDGFTKITLIQDKESILLKKTKEEIILLFELSLNSSLVIKKGQPLLKLPIGDSSFENIRRNNLLYVDKTDYIYKMITGNNKYCFISRPRRFGKSLTVSTLEAIFKGRKKLFKGLDIEKNGYNFQEYPVIRLDFSSNKITDKKSLNRVILNSLEFQAEEYEYNSEIKDSIQYLQSFVRFLKKKFGRNLVILIDEYDKPLLDNLGLKKRDEIQEELKSFFTTIKSLNEIIHFVFITGITTLSNMDLFSGANQISDLSRDKRYSEMFGYTQQELQKYFSNYIKVLSKEKQKSKEQILDKIKSYYDGYTFSETGKEIYNPYSILRLFDVNEFKNYWFASGTPTFLLNLLKVKFINLSREGGIQADNEIFDFTKLEDLSAKTLMFQAGYLVIKKTISEVEYILDFPNTEVKSSFFDNFLKSILDDSNLYPVFIKDVQKSLINRDMALLKATFNSYIKRISYTISAKKDEAYFQTIFHCLMICSAYYPNTEMATNDGRSDHIISTNERHYCIEYKMQTNKECPIQQIKDKEYYRAIQPTDKAIDLIGIKFEKNGNIVEDILIEELIR
ncbi:MAG: hypothetical protein COB02_09550 [Candidatus Cloacimonadota bacterium]|nr:MAG: hypothetical protein COB02_09550 [Candidatus Cloacimonadota bacterium]